MPALVVSTTHPSDWRAARSGVGHGEVLLGPGRVERVGLALDVGRDVVLGPGGQARPREHMDHTAATTGAAATSSPASSRLLAWETVSKSTAIAPGVSRSSSIRLLKAASVDGSGSASARPAARRARLSMRPSALVAASRRSGPTCTGDR